MIFKLFKVLFSGSSLKQKKAIWRIENRYRLEMSKLARQMHFDEMITPLSDGQKREYEERLEELLRARNKAIQVVEDHPEKLNGSGEFKNHE